MSRRTLGGVNWVLLTDALCIIFSTCCPRGSCVHINFDIFGGRPDIVEKIEGGLFF